MTLIKWRNSDLAERFALPTVFSDFFDTDLDTGEMRRFVPAVNVIENNDEFKIELAAPGLKRSDFKIEVDNGVLTISSEKKTEREEKSGGEKESNRNGSRYTKREFSYTSFRRSFSLPETVNSDNIQANYTDGVLMLTLPKREEAKPKPARQIEIK
jgi:HSP20 family protein